MCSRVHVAFKYIIFYWLIVYNVLLFKLLGHRAILSFVTFSPHSARFSLLPDLGDAVHFLGGAVSFFLEQPSPYTQQLCTHKAADKNISRPCTPA